MDFNELLPENGESSEEIKKPSEKISQSQFYDVITSRKPDWQTLIYDLIYSEQLDPWDVDIVILTRKYFEKIAELEEKARLDSQESDGPDFYISSKVLLAAALLLRIKTEFLLNKHIKSIDDILFGKKEEQKYILERIKIDEDELPVLVPKTPMPRLRRVTLNELISALNKAINTENRRIKRELALRRAKKLSEVDFPTFTRIDLKDRVRHFYAKVLTSLNKNNVENKVKYFNLTGQEREQKISCFLPLLHLSNTKKLWLEQQNHLDNIWVYLYEYFEKNKDKFIEELNFDESEEDFGFSGEMIDDSVMINIKDVEKDFKDEEVKDEIRNQIIDELNKEAILEK